MRVGWLMCVADVSVGFDARGAVGDTGFEGAPFLSEGVGPTWARAVVAHGGAEDFSVLAEHVRGHVEREADAEEDGEEVHRASADAAWVVGEEVEHQRILRECVAEDGDGGVYVCCCGVGDLEHAGSREVER